MRVLWGGELGGWVAEGKQNGVPLAVRGEFVVLRCEVGCRLLLKSNVKSGGCDELVEGVSAHTNIFCGRLYKILCIAGYRTLSQLSIPVSMALYRLFYGLTCGCL